MVTSFSDLVDPLPAIIFATAWRDKGAWQSEAERKGLRLVGRHARVAVDGEINCLELSTSSDVSHFIRNTSLGQTSMKNLRALVVDIKPWSPKMGAASALQLAQVNLPRLQKLQWWYMPLNPSIAAALAVNSAGLRELDVLAPSNGFMSGGAIQKLMEALWPALECLKIDATFVGPQVAEALAATSVAYTLKGAAHLPALRDLSLAMARLGDGGVEVLASCAWPCLEVLDLCQNDVREHGAVALAAACAAARFPKLRELHISGNRLGNAGLEALLAPTWPCLQYLGVCRTHFGLAGAQALAAASARLPMLRIMDVNGNTLLNAGLEALLAPTWHCLENLNVKGTGIRLAAGAQALAAASAARLPRLTNLNVSGNHLAAGVQELLQGNWSRLQELQLGSSTSPEGSAAAAAIGAAAAQLPALRELRLNRNGIDSAGVEALLQSPWPRLEKLDLGSNNLGPEGAAAVASAGEGAGLPVLRILDLSEARITNAGLQALVRVRWPLLEELNVGRNEFGHAAVAALVAAGKALLPALKTLRIASCNEITSADIKMLLQGAWPAATIIIYD